MPFDIDGSTVLAVTAMLILAWDASRHNRSAIAVLTGLGLMGAAVLLRVFGGEGFITNVTGLLADTGIAFLLASAVMAARKSRGMAFFLLGLFALTLALLLFAGTRLLRAGMDDAAPATSLVLEIGPDDDLAELQAILTRYGLEAERAFPSVSEEADEDLANMFVLSGAARAMQEALPALRADHENVDYIEWNRTVSLPEPLQGSQVEQTAAPAVRANDPLIESQWALTAVRGHEAHALLSEIQPQRRALVAILDTGVDAEHEDLQAVFRRSPGATDFMGHGTHCAGIAGAPANNSYGVASLNWEGRFIEIASFQALLTNGTGSYETIAQAIIDATHAGADVISLSLGDYGMAPPRVLSEAVQYALNHDVIIVAAAGNGNQDAVEHMPSNIPGVIAVAAVDQSLHKAPFSNTVAALTRPIAAPGKNILSLTPGGRYAALSGTSMATPLVAGLLGVMRALNPALSASEAYGMLQESGIDGTDVAQTGRTIDAEAAIRLTLGGL